MFNSYIVIDPSLWWDNQLLLKEAAKVLPKQQYNGTSVFLGVANTLYPMDKDTLHIRADTAGETIHIRSILQMADLLQTVHNGLQFSYNCYKGDDHMATPFPAEYDALHFLFNFYRPSPDFFKRLDDTTGKYDVIVELNSHYEKLSKKLGYTILPDEQFVNQLGYQYMYNEPKNLSLYCLLISKIIRKVVMYMILWVTII